MFNIAQEKFGVGAKPEIRCYAHLDLSLLAPYVVVGSTAPLIQIGTLLPLAAFYALFAQAFITSVRLLCEREVPLT